MDSFFFDLSKDGFDYKKGEGTQINFRNTKMTFKVSGLDCRDIDTLCR